MQGMPNLWVEEAGLGGDQIAGRVGSFIIFPSSSQTTSVISPLYAPLSSQVPTSLSSLNSHHAHPHTSAECCKFPSARLLPAEKERLGVQLPLSNDVAATSPCLLRVGAPGPGLFEGQGCKIDLLGRVQDSQVLLYAEVGQQL